MYVINHERVLLGVALENDSKNTGDRDGTDMHHRPQLIILIPMVGAVLELYIETAAVPSWVL